MNQNENIKDLPADEADGLLKPIEFNPYHTSQASRIAAA